MNIKLSNIKRTSEKTTCTATIKRGQYGMIKDYDCYRLPGDAWRFNHNDKCVKGM